MTDEQAIRVIDIIIKRYCTLDKEEIIALNTAIESIKENAKLKEAIEKAKEEIEKTSKISFSKSHWSESSGLNMALDIIGKHLKEV